MDKIQNTTAASNLKTAGQVIGIFLLLWIGAVAIEFIFATNLGVVLVAFAIGGVYCKSQA